VGLLALVDKERWNELAGANDGWCGWCGWCGGCEDPPVCKFVELILTLDVGGGGNFTPPPVPPVFAFVFAFAFVFMCPPAVPGVGGADGTEEPVGTDAGINALLSVLLAAAFSIALFSRSL